MGGSVLTSQLASIIYGSIYGFFVLIITIIAIIDLLHELSDEKDKQKEFIELHIIQSKHHGNSDNIEPETDDAKYEQKEVKYISTEYAPSMADSFYREYQKEYGYPPKKANHLIAFAKKKNTSLWWKQASDIIKTPPTFTISDEINNKPPKINDEDIPCISITSIDANSSDKIYDCKGKLKYLLMSILNKKSMYLAILVHLFDTSTDVGVIIDWYELSKQEEQNDIEGIDMKGLFLAGVCTLIFYRIISSVIIYYMTYSIKKTFLQFMDLELFETILINFKLKRSKPCDPQIFIQKMEGVLESTPQSILQLIFIWKIQKEPNYLVIISLIFSLISLSSRFSADDQKLFKQRDTKFYSYYAMRKLWRMLDVTSRIFMLTTIWVSVGGYFLSIYLFLEFLVLLIISWRLGKFEVLLGIVGIIIVNDSPKLKKYFPIYRTLMNVVLLLLCTMFISGNYCIPFLPNCPDFEYRKSLVIESIFGFIIYLYNWIAVVISAILLYVILGDTESSKTVERDFNSIIISGDSVKYDELMAFGLRIHFNQKSLKKKLFVSGFVKIILESTHYTALLDFTFRRSSDKFTAANNQYATSIIDELLIQSDSDSQKIGEIIFYLHKFNLNDTMRQFFIVAQPQVCKLLFSVKYDYHIMLDYALKTYSDRGANTEMAVSVINEIYNNVKLKNNQKRFKIIEYFIKYENINEELVLKDPIFLNCYCEMILISNNFEALLTVTFTKLKNEQNVCNVRTEIGVLIMNKIIEIYSNINLNNIEKLLQIIKHILTFENINKQLMLSDPVILNSYCEVILLSSQFDTLLTETFKGINNDNIKTNISSLILGHLFGNAHSFSILTANKLKLYQIVDSVLEFGVNPSDPTNFTKTANANVSFLKKIKTNISFKECKNYFYQIIKCPFADGNVLLIDGYNRSSIQNIDAITAPAANKHFTMNKEYHVIAMDENNNLLLGNQSGQLQLLHSWELNTYRKISAWNYSFEDQRKFGRYIIGCYDHNKRLHIIDAENKVHYVCNTANANNNFKFKQLHDLNNEYWKFNAWLVNQKGYGGNRTQGSIVCGKNNFIYVVDIIPDERVVDKEKDKRNGAPHSLCFHVYNPYNDQWTVSALYPLEKYMWLNHGTHGPKICSGKVIKKKEWKRKLICTESNDFILVFKPRENGSSNDSKQCIVYDMRADQWIIGVENEMLLFPTKQYVCPTFIATGNVLHHIWQNRQRNQYIWQKDVYEVMGYNKQIVNEEAMIFYPIRTKDFRLFSMFLNKCTTPIDLAVKDSKNMSLLQHLVKGNTYPVYEQCLNILMKFPRLRNVNQAFKDFEEDSLLKASVIQHILARNGIIISAELELNLKNDLYLNLLKFEPNMTVLNDIGVFQLFLKQKDYENLELLLNEIMKQNPKTIICNKTALDWILKFKNVFNNKQNHIENMEMKFIDFDHDKEETKDDDDVLQL
eukprot:101483_1